ncbi:MAG: hypothetical protein ACD_2C00266G0013 [uncultured bacterium (gcode 4)]|uniref:Uncharacterized protein n=1 Tax=uncultured bacterium (gcode 4) TaxID=1234023 RepID=K2G3K1_9BACT|nr:MAG: hypothetical protein ACD_2C00266G0013 [uncultured bacterium (gcode 4)]
MIAEIFQEWENYFQTYLDDVLKLRAKNLEKWQPFNVVDKDIQDNAYNVLISDHIAEYNQKKASIESEIKKIEITINKINAQFTQRVNALNNWEWSNAAQIADVKKMLEANKYKIANLEEELRRLFNNLDSIKDNFETWVRQASSLQDEILSSIKAYRDRLDLLLSSNDRELRDYIEERKKKLDEECDNFSKSLILKMDEYTNAIKNDLEAYRQKKQQDFDSIYKIDSYIKQWAKMEEETAKIQETKDKIEEVKAWLVDTNSRQFIKNITWLILLLVVSLYDYIFLSKIFVDIFDVQGWDPQWLKETLFWVVSWLNLLAGWVLLLLIFLYTMWSKVFEKWSKIEWVIIKWLVILIVLSLVVFSIVDIKLGWKWQIIYSFIQTEWVFIELVLRLLMLPVLLVWDFILLKMIVWEDFYLWDIIFKIFLSPFYLIYLTGKLFVDTFNYLTMGLIIEKKRKKVLEMNMQNEFIIKQSIKPDIRLDSDLSSILLNERTMDPIDWQYISTDSLSATLPSISAWLQSSFWELSKINDLVKSIEVDIENKIRWYSDMSIKEKAENKLKAEQLKVEQANYLQSYIEARNKLIANLKTSNEWLNEIQSSLKKWIMSWYRKYILVNI